MAMIKELKPGRVPLSRLAADGPYPNNVRKLREERRRSRRWVVQRSGVALWHQIKLETFNVELHQPIAERLAKAFDCDPLALFVLPQLPTVVEKPREDSRHTQAAPHKFDAALVLPGGKVLGGVTITLDPDIVGEIVRAALRGALKD